VVHSRLASNRPEAIAFSVGLMVCLLSFDLLPSRPLHAAPPDVRTEQKLRESLNDNFEACNREDIEGLMESCADTMPRREQFRNEAVATFKDKDIHYSLVEFEVLKVRMPFASARVVQDTHVLDRQTADAGVAAFRNSTALLPKGERVEYVCTFRKENGKWKVYVIISEMKVLQAKTAERDEAVATQ